MTGGDWRKICQYTSSGISLLESQTVWIKCDKNLFLFPLLRCTALTAHHLCSIVIWYLPHSIIYISAKNNLWGCFIFALKEKRCTMSSYCFNISDQSATSDYFSNKVLIATIQGKIIKHFNVCMPLANGLRNGTFCCPHIQVGAKYHDWLINAMSVQPSGLYKSSISESVQSQVNQCLSDPLLLSWKVSLPP